MWKSASASGSPASMLIGPSPDRVSSTAMGRRLGSGARVAGAALGAGAGSTARRSSTTMDDSLAADGCRSRARRSVVVRASASCRSTSADAGFRAAALVEQVAERGGKQPEQQPPVVREPLDERRSSLRRLFLPRLCRRLGLGLRRWSRLGRHRGSLGDWRALGPGDRRTGLGSGRRLDGSGARRRDRTRLGCRPGLGLQRREFRVADLEQAPGLGQLRLELLDARLRLTGRRARLRCGCRACVVAVDAAGVPCSGVTSRSRPLAASGPSAAGTPSRHMRYCRETSAAAADAEIAETSAALGIFSRLPARRTLMFPSNACGFVW